VNKLLKKKKLENLKPKILEKEKGVYNWMKTKKPCEQKRS